MTRTLGRLLATFAIAATVIAAPVSSISAQRLDLGTYSGGGCCGGLTRGYWFIAPTAFRITNLSIHGQSGPAQDATLQVLRLNAAPPNYSGTTNSFTSLFYLAGSTSSALNLDIAAGDVIGVLGYANGFTPYTSQRSGYVSSINGNAVTLQRFGFQDVGMAHDVWTEQGGSMGMIEMDYAMASTVPEPSTYVLMAVGLAGVVAARRRRTVRAES